ncbi:phage tail assembly protein [Terrihabitans rhizophilus]|uniref:Phage tail assembly protein n=1 Tax=Terrihabitans rhizophilus TaxID=3092662 RepID=A0ABU4RNA1_9HYPH|nr:phage tail assembly protein [Terrihabitans sp. PJ23]MDX6806302.1 phage tail assembly protein [Terrihabitans sp. PJ23]
MTEASTHIAASVRDGQEAPGAESGWSIDVEARQADFARLRKSGSETDTTAAGPVHQNAPAAEVVVWPRIEATYDPTPPLVQIPLSAPFEVAGVRVAVIELRHPAFSDVEDALRGDISELELHARMAGVSTDALRFLRWVDAELVTVCARHIAPALRTA